jgi:hypothetical protein
MANTEESQQAAKDLPTLLKKLVASPDMQKLLNHPKFPAQDQEAIRSMNYLANTLASAGDNSLIGSDVMSPAARIEYKKATGEDVLPTGTDKPADAVTTPSADTGDDASKLEELNRVFEAQQKTLTPAPTAHKPMPTVADELKKGFKRNISNPIQDLLWAIEQAGKQPTTGDRNNIAPSDRK